MKKGVNGDPDELNLGSYKLLAGTRELLTPNQSHLVLPVHLRHTLIFWEAIKGIW